MSASLVAEQLGRTAGGSRILDGVSASFAPGEASFIVGPNGAGKSTLLKILSGQLAPGAGRVLYGGVEVVALGARRLAQMRAVLSQTVTISFPMRVWEVVLMGRYPHFVGRPRAADERICDEVMEQFGVTAFADRDYLTLSGGEKQRVNFARVLAQIWQPLPDGAPRYLFLDEPLASLDIQHQLELMKKLAALASRGDLVIVAVVHDLNLAARYAHRILLLHQGRLIADGAPERTLTPENIRTAFGVEARALPGEDGTTYWTFH